MIPPEKEQPQEKAQPEEDVEEISMPLEMPTVGTLNFEFTEATPYKPTFSFLEDEVE
jgi:hypothetical protein